MDDDDDDDAGAVALPLRRFVVPGERSRPAGGRRRDSWVMDAARHPFPDDEELLAAVSVGPFFFFSKSSLNVILVNMLSLSPSLKPGTQTI